MKLLILLSFLFTVSCQSEEDFLKNIRYIDPKIQTVMDEFLEDANKYGVKTTDPDKIIRAIFVKLGHTQHRYTFMSAGVCLHRFALKKHLINVTNLDDYYREIWIATHHEPLLFLRQDLSFKSLIYHELGHCLLNKEHDPREDSIMYYTMQDYVDPETWDDEVRYLFTGEK